METNECIICFELVNSTYNVSLFECNHKENMHLECIYELNICPLCRAPRKNNVHVCVYIIQARNIHYFCFSICTLMYIILTMLIIHGYQQIKEHMFLSNTTYTVDHI